MRKYIILSFLLLLALSCSREKSNFRITCQVNASGGNKIFLERRTLTGTVPVDSALPDRSGNYKLRGYTLNPDFFVVYLQPKHYINLIIHPGDNFKVLTEAPTFDYNYTIEGSKDSRLIQKLVTMQTKTLAKITELSNQYDEIRGMPNFEQLKAHIDSTYDKIFQEHRKFSIQLIMENPGSLASLITLYQQLGRNSSVFDIKKDYRYYEMVDSNLRALYPQSAAVMDLNRKLTEIGEQLKLEANEVSPDLNMPDVNGNNIALSSLKGDYVLVIFWASWSAESHEMNRILVQDYYKFHDKGLEIYQVSLDRTRESWLKGIDGDKLPGIQVCDFKYWDSPAVESYRVTQLPTLFLLDRDGKILYPSLTISNLDQQLSEVFTPSKK